MWVYYSYDELYHHGILGMRWGKKNGPPYPLAPEDHSASEKKAGWQKSLGLSDTQKKALAVAALATIGGVALYKSGALDKLVSSGRSQLSGSVVDAIKEIPKQKIQEAKEYSLQLANPHKLNPSASQNCVPSSIIGYLRTKGYNVQATSNGPFNPGGSIEKVFKNAKVLDGSAVKFGKSIDDAKEMLLNKFGNNAAGTVSIDWKSTASSGGHTFNYEIRNGVVRFMDFQKGSENVSTYWRAIDPTGNLTITNLEADGVEIDFDELQEFLFRR